MMSVTAKPLMGPVPNWKRNRAEMMVVMLPSTMADMARRTRAGWPP